MHQEIVLGESGQVFEVEASVLPREPVSVVVTSWTGEVQQAVASCVIDRVATVLAEDAPRGARVLHVGSTRGIAPNTRYDVGGQRFTVYRLDGEHRLILRRPLLEPAKEDAALRGCRILAAVDDAWARDVSKLTEQGALEEGYQLAWTHAEGTERTTADLVRVPLHVRITPDDIERLAPGWRAAVTDPALAIAEAAEIVRRDVLRHPEIRRVRDAAAIRELVIMRARIVAVEQAVMFRGASYTTLTDAERPYHARIEAMLARPPAPRPAPPPANESSRYSLEHVRILDEITAWFEARERVEFEAFRHFAKSFMPRVRTPEERQIVSRYLSAQQHLTKGARRLRTTLLAELAMPASPPPRSHGNSAVDWLAYLLEKPTNHHLSIIEKHFIPQLATRDEYQRALEALVEKRHLATSPDADAVFARIIDFLSQGLVK